jgi:hypothetical protein
MDVRRMTLQPSVSGAESMVRRVTMSKKPETYQEAVENVSKAFKELGTAVGDAAISDTEELRKLVQAATQKMKDDHQVMMRRARKQIAWLLFLVACAVAYEVWAIPALQRYFWP